RWYDHPRRRDSKTLKSSRRRVVACEVGSRTLRRRVGPDDRVDEERVREGRGERLGGAEICAAIIEEVDPHGLTVGTAWVADLRIHTIRARIDRRLRDFMARGEREDVRGIRNREATTHRIHEEVRNAREVVVRPDTSPRIGVHVHDLGRIEDDETRVRWEPTLGDDRTDPSLQRLIVVLPTPQARRKREDRRGNRETV